MTDSSLPQGADPLVLRTATQVGTITAAFTPLESAGRNRWRVVLTAGSDGFVGTGLPRDATEFGRRVAMVSIPGLFYGDNRSRGGEQRWPCLAGDASGFMHPRWDFALDRTAAPLLLAHDGDVWSGLDWTPHYRVDGAPAGRSVW